MALLDGYGLPLNGVACVSQEDRDTAPGLLLRWRGSPAGAKLRSHRGDVGIAVGIDLSEFHIHILKAGGVHLEHLPQLSGEHVGLGCSAGPTGSVCTSRGSTSSTLLWTE